MPSARVITATSENPRRFPKRAEAEADILYRLVDRVSGHRFTTFLLEPAVASKLDPGASLRLWPVQAIALKGIGAELHVRLKFFLHLSVRLATP